MADQAKVRRQMLTQEELKRQLSYDPDTEVFKWAIRKLKVKFGAVAGKTKPKGYIEIRVNLVSYQAHRLAWLYVHGVWPDGLVDHINRNPSDNRIENLRVANHQQNFRNVPVGRRSSTGIKGVSPHAASGKYRAAIRVDKRRIWLGLFSTVEEAAQAYRAASEAHHGEFAHHE
ncbi:HNH endonuclease [Pseudomonas typographi]|uniref:HNH endonuclease n=1 Tax=Pseudomonas typographi TaxID=2715964 RepID=A0ABR7Z5B3_9PSED|nr:HNH endonuclease [Pseudomonas typographi]MBD1600660.1 HNH endonuclease [Pseudomonas typographi]